MQRPDQDRETLLDLVEAGLELLESGREVDLDELCREHPELRDEVAETLDLRSNVGQLHRLASETDPLIGGEIADRYRIDARIGMGAMGVVYRAYDLKLKREVAVKTLHGSGFGRDDLEARFVREAEALASLRHPNILAVYDCGRANGGMYLVTDLLEGAPASVLLERAQPRVLFESNDASWIGAVVGEATVGSAARVGGYLHFAAMIAFDVAEALIAAHASVVLHRDVKPSNIFLTRELRAILLDFGLAKRGVDGDLTAEDTVVGSPWYMAPEQAAGRTVGEATDVYGLAATLYHLVTLRPPFDGDLPGILTRIQLEDPVPAARLRPGIPRDLVAILDKGLAREPHHRYPSVADFADDLRAFLEHRPVSARPLTWVGRTWRSALRHRSRSVAALTTVLALLFALIALPLWVEASTRDRQAEKARLDRSLPARLAIEGDPEQRLLIPLDERSDQLALLDRILELDPGDLPVRLLRAALLVDRGQPGDAARAADELDRLGAQTESNYVRAVAARFREAGADARGAFAIDLSDLELEPVTPEECFIAGFHELRNRHIKGFPQRARQLLDRAAERYVAARDLRLLALLALGEVLDGEQQRAAYRDALEEASWLEGHYGYATARTRSVTGVALWARGDLDAAIEALQESLELRPDRHGPLHNIGLIYQRQHRFREASQFLQRALDVRPWFWNSQYHLAILAAQLHDFERARELAAALDEDAMGDRGWHKPLALATVEMFAAIAALEAGAAEQVEEFAQRSAKLFAETAAAQPKGLRRNRSLVSRQLMLSLIAEDSQRAFREHLKLLALDPLNPQQIDNMLALLPDDGIDASAIRVLRHYFHRLRKRIAPEQARRTNPR